jgi:Cu/Ag efflux pump CusA
MARKKIALIGSGQIGGTLGVAIVGSIFSTIYIRHLSDRESPLVRWLKRGDTKLLRWSFGNGGLLLGVSAAAVFIAGFAATRLPRAFLPPFNEGTLTIGMTFTPGISLAESNRLGAIAETLVMKVPEVKTIGRRTGRAGSGSGWPSSNALRSPTWARCTVTSRPSRAKRCATGCGGCRSPRPRRPSCSS